MNNDPRITIQYNTLRAAIPKNMVCNLIREYNKEQYNSAIVQKQKQISEHIEIRKIKDMSSSELRTKLAYQEDLSICGKEFWKRKFNIDVKDNYTLAKQATKESRLRILHFKLLHNIYPTNITLHKMGVKESDKCEVCNEKDYIEHMFAQCTALNGFWNAVSCCINGYTGVNIQLTTPEILFGVAYSTRNLTKSVIDKINHIILVAKMSISKFRYGKPMGIKLIFETEIELRRKYLQK